MIQTIPISDRASWLAMRRQDVTASAAGCLLGVHEYTSAYGLWATKTGRIPDDGDETPAMRRGRLLEPVVAAMLAEDHPEWAVRSPGVYLRDPEARLGATPDLFVECPNAGAGIVQVKTTADLIFRQKWRDPDTREVELPLWIAVQAILEAHLSGRQWAKVAVMVVGMGLDLHLIDVPIHEGVIARIRGAVADFWKMVGDGRTPDPDYGRDAAVIERLYAADNGETIDLTSDNTLPAIVEERASLSAEKNAAEKRLKEIKAEILAKVGNHAVARISGGKIITAKTVRRGAYSVEATQYRDVRIKEIAA